MSENTQGLHLEQKQRLRLSQQHLRYVKMLELNAPELDEAVERELADNPALEALDTPAPEDEKVVERSDDTTPYYLRRVRNREADEPVSDYTPPDETETLYDFLKHQIAERDVREEVAATADYLVGNMDSNGYIRRPLYSMLDDLAFTQSEEVSLKTGEEALDLIKELDPAGVGAADLQECLLLQLRRMPRSPERDDAIRIIEDQFEAFAMKHYHKIVSYFGMDRERMTSAINLILTLNPKPGASFASGSEQAGNVIIPDLIVENYDGELVISLNNNIPELGIEESFAEAVDNLNRSAAKRKARKGNEFLLSRYNEARDFIRILRQRQQTVMAVMTAIVEIQKDYFLTEDVDRMKPMKIKDISERTGLDIPTVSRATANKYVGTGWGIFPLRHFFSDTIGDPQEGPSLTNRRIEAEIEKIIAGEDKHHPLSDQKICDILQAKGFNLSRRTVTKYRVRKDIPVARLRHEM